MIYFDHAATSPLHPEVYESYIKLLKEHFANSESTYDLGVLVSKNLEKSRALTAGLLGVKPQDIIFTSGASEANNMAIKSIAFAYKDKGNHIISSNVEHSSVKESLKQLETVFGFDITYLEVNSQGTISLQQVESAIRPNTILVSIMAVNNEVGSINPVQEIAKLCHAKKILCHVDAVQALNKIDLDYSLFDLASFSAHKLGGLKGSGILMKKSHLKMEPLISGGAQEFSLRGGTSDALVHTMFYKTLSVNLKEKEKSQVLAINRYLRNKLEAIKNAVIHTPVDGSPYILSFSLLGFQSEMLANALNQAGIYCSYRSTCHNRDAKGSAVLMAMKKSQAEMNSVIRISFENSNTIHEAQIFMETLEGVIDQYG